VVLEKDGEDQVNLSCENKRSITQNEGGNEYPTCNKKKANWISHILRRNCLVKHIIEERIEVTKKGRRRRRQLLDNLK
jgi:hypothetical protein